MELFIYEFIIAQQGMFLEIVDRKNCFKKIKHTTFCLLPRQQTLKLIRNCFWKSSKTRVPLNLYRQNNASFNLKINLIENDRIYIKSQSDFVFVHRECVIAFYFLIYVHRRSMHGIFSNNNRKFFLFQYFFLSFFTD